jgi:uncharacterized protein (TIGR03086 family)
MSTEPLEAAIASTRAVLAAVKPNQLGDATPCASWTVSALINHIVGGQFWFAANVNGDAPSGEAPDFAAGDFLAAFDQGSAASVAAFKADGALGRMLKLPFGDMPGAAFLGLATTDTFTHGWDLAKATGQSTDLAPQLAARLLEGARGMIQPAFRGPEGAAPFGPEQEADEGASNADKLAAFLGRSV